MKLFTTPALLKDDGNFRAALVYQSYKYRYWFCINKTRKIFGLPQNTTKIWFEFYDRPGIDRWPVKVVDDKDDVTVKIDEVKHTVSGYTARWLISRLNRTKCYVACYYETEGEDYTLE